MTNVDDARNSTIAKSVPMISRSLGHRKQRLRSAIRWTAIGFLSLVVAGGILTGLLAYQVHSVKNHLSQALDLVPVLRMQVAEGNNEMSHQTVDQMREHISAARSTATGPLWKVASIVPVAGPNFRAVSEVAVSADDLSIGAVAPLLDKYTSIDWQSLSPTNGKIDVVQLREAAPTISAAANTVKLSHERMATIELSGLVPQVADPIRSVTAQLQEMSSALESVSSAAQLLPVMLGADGPRSYLVLIQNSAESRATGGIPGALAILNTDDGRISLGRQSSAGSIGAFRPPLVVDAEQEEIFTARLGTQMQNVNLTPDFPTAARTAKSMWEERHSDETIDGVFAIDAVVLGHLLKATGPVVLRDPAVLRLIQDTSLPRSLTEENVVTTLLSDVYREIGEPAAQDIYFASVAAEVFTAFSSGRGDSHQLLKALSTSVEEDRLTLWSSQRDEQEIIASTALAGSVVGAGSGGSTFGVYFNDGTGAKMDYYSTRTVRLLETCQSDGYSSFRVRINATNTAPRDSASSLPSYVTGGGAFGVAPGRIRTNYVVYGPAQAFVESATINGNPVPVGSGKHAQRPVGTVALELGPGESAEMDIVFSHVVQDSEPQVQVTPTIESPAEVILQSTRESCG